VKENKGRELGKSDYVVRYGSNNSIMTIFPILNSLQKRGGGDLVRRGDQ
jgi:hypothetical protein